MQKEQLSALMDGEIPEDKTVFFLLQNQDLQTSWKGYHLIRDTLRGDLDAVIHLDLSARIAAAIEQETVLSAITEQPTPVSESSQPLWQKIRRWGSLSGFGSQLAQAGLAAAVSLVVIASVQHFGDSGSSATPVESEQSPAFITLPLNGKTAPVSFGVPDNVFDNALDPLQIQAQRNNVSAMLKDFELQRRLRYESSASLPSKSSVLHNSANP